MAGTARRARVNCETMPLSRLKHARMPDLEASSSVCIDLIDDLLDCSPSSFVFQLTPPLLSMLVHPNRIHHKQPVKCIAAYPHARPAGSHGEEQVFTNFLPKTDNGSTTGDACLGGPGLRFNHVRLQRPINSVLPSALSSASFKYFRAGKSQPN